VNETSIGSVDKYEVASRGRQGAVSGQSNMAANDSVLANCDRQKLSSFSRGLERSRRASRKTIVLNVPLSTHAPCTSHSSSASTRVAREADALRSWPQIAIVRGDSPAGPQESGAARNIHQVRCLERIEAVLRDHLYAPQLQACSQLG
jgi:hypothetical protein